MPALANARHERFCREVNGGKSGTEAYAIAFGREPDATANVNASRLLSKANIKARVDELAAERFEMARAATERAAERLSVTVESLIAEAEEARSLAMSLGQPAAAVSAIKEKGVLSGKRIEKSERRNIGDVRSLTDAELDAAIAEAEALAGAEGQEGYSGLAH